MSPDDKMIEMLILSGALELSALDSEGNPLYVVTPKMQEIMPDLYDMHISEVNDKIKILWDKGFVTVNFDDDNDFKVKITDKALDEEELSKLSKEERWSIEEIKRITRID